MGGYLAIGLIDFTLKDKSLTNLTIFFTKQL